MRMTIISNYLRKCKGVFVFFETRVILHIHLISFILLSLFQFSNELKLDIIYSDRFFSYNPRLILSEYL